MKKDSEKLMEVVTKLLNASELPPQTILAALEGVMINALISYYERDVKKVARGIEMLREHLGIYLAQEVANQLEEAAED